MASLQTVPGLLQMSPCRNPLNNNSVPFNTGEPTTQTQGLTPASHSPWGSSTHGAGRKGGFLGWGMGWSRGAQAGPGRAPPPGRPREEPTRSAGRWVQDGPGGHVLPLPSARPGGTLWSHLLSQARPQHPGLRPGSTQERTKAQLRACLSLRTPARLPSGHSPGQDTLPLEPPRTSQSLPPARGPPAPWPHKAADGEPTARTTCSSDLPRTPAGLLHLHARRAGQSSTPGLPRGLSWVHQGAGRVLGACGRGRGQSRPPADEADLWRGRAWSVSEEQVRRWAAETLLALEALHEQGVLCRDLNPRNLLLDQAGGCPGHRDPPRHSGGRPANPQRRELPTVTGSA